MPLTSYTAGDVLTAASLNDNFTFAANNFPQHAIFNETQANNTQGGTFTSGSYVKRTLNTTVVNTITSCTLTSSVISLPAGTYKVFATAGAAGVGRHKCRLRNTTDSATIALGQNSIADTGAVSQTLSVLETEFTLAATKDLELQHRCQTTRSTDGLGAASNFSDDEIYSIIEIVKLA
jgi:hypothetical protein